MPLLILLVLAAGLLMSHPALAQPRLHLPQTQTYRVGDRIDASSFVFDHQMQRVEFGALLKPETRVAVLVLFGGAVKEVPAGEPFRGELWCLDSFDDLGVQRALVHAFQSRPEIQFIPIALPPVYNPTRYGYSAGVFLETPEDSETYRQDVGAFVRLTEKQKESGLLPFQEVYYDPRFLLAQHPGEQAPVGASFSWQGRLRWNEDARKYGTPIIWLLGPGGEILQAPFHSNDYDSDPPQILYGFAELREAIARHAGLD